MKYLFAFVAAAAFMSVSIFAEIEKLEKSSANIFKVNENVGVRVQERKISYNMGFSIPVEAARLAKYFADAENFCRRKIIKSTDGLVLLCDQQLQNIQFYQNKLENKIANYPRVNDSDSTSESRSKRAVGAVALLGIGAAAGSVLVLGGGTFYLVAKTARLERQFEESQRLAAEVREVLAITTKRLEQTIDSLEKVSFFSNKI
jgi:hypothetical protein